MGGLKAAVRATLQDVFVLSGGYPVVSLVLRFTNRLQADMPPASRRGRGWAGSNGWAVVERRPYSGTGRRSEPEGQSERFEKRKIMGRRRGCKKVQNPLARLPEVPYIRRPFLRSRD
jgi:hypothetical protein